MKIVIALLVVACAVNVFSHTVEEEWTTFKVKYNRHYKAPEEKTRFEIFRKNLNLIKAQNAKLHKGESTWEAGINEYSDKTEEEHNKLHGVVHSIPAGVHHHD